MAENGGGGTGGDTSVFWEIRHGSKASPQRPAPYTGGGLPPRGSVKVDRIAEGHSNADFEAIGQPDHAGLFKVILRFRDAEWDKLPAAQKAWVDQQAERVGTDRLLTIYVPAIRRPMPTGGGQWADMPWEIQWEW